MGAFLRYLNLATYVSAPSIRAHPTRALSDCDVACVIGSSENAHRRWIVSDGARGAEREGYRMATWSNSESELPNRIIR